jgi:hypothetical protein
MTDASDADDRWLSMTDLLLAVAAGVDLTPAPYAPLRAMSAFRALVPQLAPPPAPGAVLE